MTPENFCYWLQGFFEVSKATELTPEQVEEVKNHLKLVFNKVTPNYTVNQFNPNSTQHPRSWKDIEFCSQSFSHASC